jgi:PPK2 family polyphosphate:nucleotide phosphotransferase
MVGAAVMANATHRYRIAPQSRFDLHDCDPDDRSAFRGGKTKGRQRAEQLASRLDALQEALYAQGRHRLLVVLQAMDAGGKDGVIRSVFEGVNPQGVRVHCFKQPTSVELAHDFLWRVHPHVPGNGEIAIFNRSHYEDVIVARVQKLVPKAQWRARYRHIVEFERMLADEGTVIRKFFLHISGAEQRERLQERIDDPKKRWKFQAGDLHERARWGDYMAAYSDALRATSTDFAPWYVVPADRNWYRDLIVAEVLVDTLSTLDLRLPKGDPGFAGMKVK